MPTSLHPTEAAAHRPLCPACGADSIRIHLSIEVEIDVVVDDLVDDLQVVDESLGDAAWDTESLAACPLCDWRGTVGDLHQRVLIGSARG